MTFTLINGRKSCLFVTSEHVHSCFLVDSSFTDNDDEVGNHLPATFIIIGTGDNQRLPVNGTPLVNHVMFGGGIPPAKQRNSAEPSSSTTTSSGGLLSIQYGGSVQIRSKIARTNALRH